MKKTDSYKIILFGSYVDGKSNQNSDIDLYIITNDHHLPKSFNEKMEIKLQFSKLLDPIRKQFPIDLIVHTLSMHDRFIQLDSVFSREIMRNGNVIYETNNE